ncbi:MAG: DUF1192 domain-containing protein [Novosphingobium sp.]|nr:DUF1192 domain-containing protein [Novosphingobium sp.]
MELDDRPRPKGDAASHLAGELLDSYSQDELTHRIALLEAEIERVAAHRDKKAAHMRAAASLFAAPPSSGPPSGASSQ